MPQLSRNAETDRIAERLLAAMCSSEEFGRDIERNGQHGGGSMHADMVSISFYMANDFMSRRNQQTFY